jgi:predicted nucleic acid-binding protein
MGEAVTQIIVIDTDILIDAGYGISEALRCLNHFELNAGLAISVITEMELLIGCRNKKESLSLAKFLKRFMIIKLTESISDKAVNLLKRYRLSHGILIPDAIIAATALDMDCLLLTKNQRDYRFIDGLKLSSYPIAIT